MVTSAHAKLALNFFFLLLSDEPLAITAASQAIHGYKKKLEIEKNSGEALLISEMLKTLAKIKSKAKYKQVVGSHSLPSSEWKVPQPQSLSRWKEYLHKSDGQSEVVLVLRYVLDVPVKVISEAMRIPEGTVMYRIGRGLELLSIL